jgi:hypothetical protein
MVPTSVLTCAASQLDGTSNNTNNIHAFFISSRLLEVFPAHTTRTDNFPQITARFDAPLQIAKGAAGFEFWGSSIAVMKGRLSGSLSVHLTVDFPSLAHSVAFYDVKCRIFGSQRVMQKLTSCLLPFGWL